MSVIFLNTSISPILHIQNFIEHLEWSCGNEIQKWVKKYFVLCNLLAVYENLVIGTLEGIVYLTNTGSSPNLG